MKNTFELGKGYTHFAIDKKTGLIITGWDYKGYSHADLMESKKDFFEMDLVDFNFKLKDVKIIRRSNLVKILDVKNPDNWYKSEAPQKDLTNEEIKGLIINKGLTIMNVIDNVIELNGIIGVGLISLGDGIRNYIIDKSK